MIFNNVKKRFATVILLFFFLIGTAYAGETKIKLKSYLDAIAEGSSVIGNEVVHAIASVKRFYTERNFQPAWTAEGQRQHLQELQMAVRQSFSHGLTPREYHLALLTDNALEKDPPRLEILATDAYLTLAAHILGGRLNPESYEPDWTANRRERDLVKHLEMALASGRLLDSIEELEPDVPDYKALKKALAMYREIAGNGGWPIIEEGKPLKIGDNGTRVQALAKRLQSTGLLAKEYESTDLFDVELEAAVAAFQKRIGLEADGIVGPITLRELNKSPMDRIEQIRANLERWRWLPENLGKRHIRVNIADYHLAVYQDNQLLRSHDVIVGRTYRKTPVFSDQIAYLVFNPWWETPNSLARLDKLPAFRKDPASVEKLGFEVLDRQGSKLDPKTIDWQQYSNKNFPLRLRQRPGPQNALGQVKIMFPNKHNVYLHDTPSQQLFSHTERAFSSGCIRVANVINLTEWLLSETPGWDRHKINAILVSGLETRVNLQTKVPVHLLYFTAVTEPDGDVRLLNDIYQRDRRVIEGLADNAALLVGGGINQEL